MNKLKFNAGGQPVYLDDFNVLQELPAEYASAILRGLLTSPVIEGEIKKLKAMFPFGTENIRGYFLHFYPIQIEGSRWRFDPGCIFLDGEILDFAGGGFDLISGSPFYVIVHNDPLNVRTLDNGSQESCGVSRYAEISATPSETLPSYPSSQLGDLMDTIALKMRAKLNILSEEWTPLNVTFKNGYSGTVERRETTDCYRIKIKIRSGNNSTVEGTRLNLFDILDDPWDGLRDFSDASCVFYTSGNGNSGGNYILHGSDDALSCLRILPSGETYVERVNGSTAAWRPSSTPINVIFDLPK